MATQDDIANWGITIISIYQNNHIEGLHRAKLQGKVSGRPKGSKDGKPRRKSGYILREANKRKVNDESLGIHKSIESYID